MGPNEVKFIRPCFVFIDLLYTGHFCCLPLPLFYHPPNAFLSINQQGVLHPMPRQAYCLWLGEWPYSWAELAFLVATDFSLWVLAISSVCLLSRVSSRLLLLGVSQSFS